MGPQCSFFRGVVRTQKLQSPCSELAATIRLAPGACAFFSETHEHVVTRSPFTLSDHPALSCANGDFTCVFSMVITDSSRQQLWLKDFYTWGAYCLRL